MKIRPIPETELARICVKPIDEQPILLRRLNGFKPPHTLNPFRRVIRDLMNVQYEMLGKSSETNWSIIERQIVFSKENAAGKAINLELAKALYTFAVTNNLVSYDKPVPRWQVSFGNTVEYWQHFYSVWSGKASFVHVDPRLSNPLTLDARRFAFSMMHERLRVDDPDFEEIGLTIFQFGRADNNERFVKLHSSENVEFFNRDELGAMIDATYELWFKELKRREEDVRKATGTDNPMGF